MKLFLFLCLSSPALDESDFWLQPNQCGAWAVYQSALANGRSVARQEVVALLPADGAMKSLTTLRQALTTLGIPSLGVRFADRRLPEASGTAILPLRPVRPPETIHYVTAVGWSGGSALVVDGPYGHRWMSKSELKDRWSGDALLVGEASIERCGPPSFWTPWAGWLILALGVVGLTAASRRRTCIAALPAILAAASFGCGHRSEKTPDAAAPAVPAPYAARIEIEPSATLEATIPENVVKESAVLLTTGFAEFTLHNRGTDAVRVGGFDSTCGCSVLENPTRLIEPGGKEAFRILVRGNVQQDWRGVITVRFEGLNLRPLPIEVIRKGRLGRQELVGSRQLCAPRPLRAGEHEVQIALRTHESDRKERWLSRARSTTSAAAWSVKEEKVYDKKGGVAVDYQLTGPVANRSPGQYVETVELLDGAGAKIDSITVAYEILARLRTAPPVINAVCEDAAASTFTRKVMISCVDGKASDTVAIASLPSIPPWLELRLEPRADALRVLHVRILPQSATSSSKGEFAIQVNWEGHGTTTLPVAVSFSCASSQRP
jgi:hypothetical protein